jgi:RNA polymerase sigma-70 factor (ECF subfamily)
MTFSLRSIFTFSGDGSGDDLGSATGPRRGGLALVRPAVSVAMSDQQLAERIRADDPEALRMLFERYADRLTAFATRLIPAGAAEDVVQDAFILFWNRRAKIDPDRNVRALLYATVRTRALNARHRDIREAHWRASAAAIGETPAMSSLAPVDSPIEQDELSRALAAAFAELPPRARQTAILRWHDQLGRAEIAEIMGVSIPTVNNQLTHAARVLRTLLGSIHR